MSQLRIPGWVFRLLVAAAIVLMITICVIWAVSLLLGEMGDTPGQRALRYVALAAGVLVVVDLICLVLAQGLNALDQKDKGE